MVEIRSSSFRRDLRYLQFLYRIFNIFAIIPVYDFKKRTLTKPSLHKIHAFVIVSVLSVIFIFSLFDQNLKVEPKSQTTFNILNFLNSTFLTLEVITMIIASNFLNRANWLKLNLTLQHVDEKLNNINRKEKSILSFYFQFFLTVGAFVTCSVHAIYKALKYKPEIVLSKSFVMQEFCYTEEYFIILLICNIAMAFKIRYDDISAILSQTKTSESIREIGQLWRKLTAALSSLNKIFGLPLIFLNAREVMQILLCLQFALLAFNRDFSLKENVFSKEMFQSIAIIFAYIALCTIFVIMCCDSAASAGRKLKLICYEMQENFPAESKERKELFHLAQEVSDNPARITAANFFEVNRSTFFGLLSVTATYFIIIIQFNV